MEELEENKVKIVTALEEHGTAPFLRMIEKKINKWKSLKVNLAIAGRTGTGKSSFINAVVKKWTGTRPAEVGCVGYEHPNNPNILLWDLPEVGTKNFPQESYLEKVNADLYDVVIIMTADKFTEQHKWLGKKMQERKKPVIFVRTKIGIDVENSKDDYVWKDEKTILKEVKADAMAECSKFIQASGVFLIDSHKSDMYEFSDLEKCIVKKLSPSKGRALVFSISRMSRDTVKLKVTELKKIEMISVGSIILGLSTVTVRSYTSFYVQQLGLDVQSLERRAVDPEMLNSVKGKVEKVMADIPSIVDRPVAIQVLQLMPLVGESIISHVVRNSLKCILIRLKTIALEAIDAFNERD